MPSLKFKLVVTNDPVVEELEFESLEALQAKVNELQPKPEEGEDKPGGEEPKPEGE